MTTDLTANTTPPNPLKKKKKRTHSSALEKLPQPESPEEKLALEIAISERGKNLKKLVDIVLHTVDARERARYVTAMTLLADGSHHLDVTGSIPSWNHGQCQALKRHHPLFYKLWRAAEDAGDTARRVYREYLAHKHATEGVEKPVFQQGVEVGRIREFDHRLLEFLLKADNPAKYRDQSAQVNVQNNVVSRIVEIHRFTREEEVEMLKSRDNVPPPEK